MKASSFIFMILLIGLIFVAFGLMVSNFEEQYVDTGISPVEPLNSTYRQGFFNSTEINETFSPLIDDIDKIKGGEKTGGFSLFAAIEAIPNVLIHLIAILINFVFKVGSLIMNIFILVGIPIEIIIFITIGLTIVVIFMIIEFLRRYPA